MNVVRCDLEGLLIIEPKVFGDPRGFFMETWNQKRYEEAGLPGTFVQDNISYSCRGTLRGLHYQNPGAQGKLVSVLEGEVFDVAVDVRRSSRTFGKWHGLNLSSGNRLQFYIPPGFAHGFVVLSEAALFHYKCTDVYQPAAEVTIHWQDPQIGIQWPMSNPILSQKDIKGLALKDVPGEKLFS